MQPMDGEATLGTASLEQARYWQRTYREILTMEESVLRRIRELMASESEPVRREVERSNVPVVVAQAERFRARLEFWSARGRELESTPCPMADEVTERCFP